MNDITPRVDFAFKKLFGTEENKDLLISLINSIISEEDQIVSLEIKNPYNFAQFRSDKESILDIKARDANGTYFNVEMQVGTEVNFDKRTLYYWSNLVSSQLKRGDIYDKITKTICINILAYNIIRNSDEYHNEYKILNTKTGKDDGLHGVLEIHYIELRKFKKDFNELTNSLDRWITFLNKADRLNKNKLPKELASDAKIVKALTSVELMFDDDERETYENRLKFHTTILSSFVSSNKLNREEGREEGRNEERLKIAKDLVKVMSVVEIQKLTGLTKEEIETLL